MRLSVLVLFLALFSLSSTASAQGKPKPGASAKPTGSTQPKTIASDAPATSGTPLDELDLSPQDKKKLETFARLKWTPGPTKIALAFECSVDLPEAYQYLDVPQSKKLLEAYGHTHNEHTLGIISPKGDEPWQIYLDYSDDGYIKDDEKLDGDELLKTMKEGQAEANKERAQLGHEPLDLLGWSEQPTYDKSVHHVIWGLRVKAPSDTEESINYNTRILGRKGYVSVNLVTDAAKLPEFKARANEILKATTFNAQARYEDHTSGDKVAEYGLATLILGGAGLGAAKIAGKVGIIALLAKGGKGIFLLLAAPFLALKKFFGKKGEAAPPPGGAS